MMWNRLCTFSVLLLTALSLNQAEGNHSLEKRQIGVLARAGELPQGKRSALLLSGYGEPHQRFTNKKDINDYYLNVLYEELKNAETLTKLGFLALTEKMTEEEEALERQPGVDVNKRSVAALARNGELPQKRVIELMTRSGYLTKPPQETVRPSLDLLYSDDFLVGAQSAFGFSPERDAGVANDFFQKNFKRTLGSARNFLLAGNKNRDSKNDYKKSNWPDSYDSEFRDEDKKNVRTSNSFGKREIPKNLLSQYGSTNFLGNPQKNEDKSLRGENKKNKREVYFEKFREESAIPFFQNIKQPIYEDISTQFEDEENAIEKRFLGRIPQLGRIHQKAQSPSARRRPHLRPNWL